MADGKIYPFRSDPPTEPHDPEAVAIIAAEAMRAVRRFERGDTQWQLDDTVWKLRIERGDTEWQRNVSASIRSINVALEAIADEQMRQAKANARWPKLSVVAALVFGAAMGGEILVHFLSQ